MDKFLITPKFKMELKRKKKQVLNKGQEQSFKPIVTPALPPKGETKETKWKNQHGQSQKGLSDAQIQKQLLEDARWLLELNDMKQFSLPWVQKVLVEIMLQCMGKKSIVITDIFGNEQIVKIFRESGALRALEMIAKLNGHKLHEIAVNFSQTNIQNNYNVEIPTNEERTATILTILESIGKIPTRGLESNSNTEMVKLHST